MTKRVDDDLAEVERLLGQGKEVVSITALPQPIRGRQVVASTGLTAGQGAVVGGLITAVFSAVVAAIRGSNDRKQIGALEPHLELAAKYGYELTYKQLDDGKWEFHFKPPAKKRG